MIGTSKKEYWFIRVCIVGLHHIAPLCIAYCVLLVCIYGFKATTYRFPLLVETGAILEALFYFAVYVPHNRYIQRETAHPPAPAREERKQLFALCNDNITNCEGYLRKWFLGAEIEEIKRENVKEFLLWAFFNRGGLPGDDDDELEEYVSATEKLLGRPIQEGRGSAKPLRLTLDGVDMLHRSLIWYFCVGFVDLLTFIKLRYHGFHFHRTSFSRFFSIWPLRPYSYLTSQHSPAKHTTYWHRAHTSKTKLPVVFLHGIGIGLYPYTNFLSELNSSQGLETSNPNDQVGIIAIEIMPVSFRITHAALSREALCAEITSIVRKHFGDQKFVLSSHSYGTVISTHLLAYPPLAEQIGPVVLIDPVSIMLHLPDVAYNFTRRQPVHANEFQLYYFASMDSGVAHTLARHFFWNENILWKKDLIFHKTTVSLGGQDLIVNTEAVGQYLSEPISGFESRYAASASSSRTLIDIDKSTEIDSGLRNRGNDTPAESDDEQGEEEWKNRPWRGDGIDVLWFSGLDHAQVFDKPATRRRLINCIRAYCEDTD
ncbi:hypothetical protein BJ878DRAFT_150702 [Calycina marina]|uniref:AB hydrolase-1 domain-containing protein n=1 Tax=Calycina marina TaxID=1763456 RepID=A0A9P8CJ32_9HELO|nr:hypothetical protein BJ878DRAFT_150702 [Calycina marina]